jgi:hypothetical protein
VFDLAYGAEVVLKPPDDGELELPEAVDKIGPVTEGDE